MRPFCLCGSRRSLVMLKLAAQHAQLVPPCQQRVPHHCKWPPCQLHLLPISLHTLRDNNGVPRICSVDEDFSSTQLNSHWRRIMPYPHELTLEEDQLLGYYYMNFFLLFKFIFYPCAKKLWSGLFISLKCSLLMCLKWYITFDVLLLKWELF